MSIKTWQERSGLPQGTNPRNCGGIEDDWEAEITELRVQLSSSERKCLELSRVYSERGLQISRLETALERIKPPAYIGMSQAGLGAEAHGYVRGWNDCVDAVKGKE